MAATKKATMSLWHIKPNIYKVLFNVTKTIVQENSIYFVKKKKRIAYKKLL
jgi:hypothetical protein